MRLDEYEWIEGRPLHLFVETFSNATRIVQIRGFTQTAQIIADHTTNSDRSLATSVIPITEIPKHLTVRTAETNVKRGECYVKVSVRVEGVVVALLIAGYVSDTGTRVYPGGVIESSIEGPGLIRSITGTDPAAGVEISETVPIGVRWRLKKMRVTFVTDATVAGRRSHFRFDDGINLLWDMAGSGLVQASSTIIDNFSEIGVRIVAIDLNETLVIPPDNRLMAGFKITTLTTLMQAGDNYDAPQLLVEEWIEP